MTRVMIPALMLALLAGCSAVEQPPNAQLPEQGDVVCNDHWYASVEERLGTGDGQGHGPDLGSAEWKSVVAFRLGLRGAATLPEPSSEAWCRYIEEALQNRATPADDCPLTPKNGIGVQVCTDAELRALDGTLNRVYRRALEAEDDELRPRLRAEQRGWIKGRDECWKSDQVRACIDTSYERRIAELQARYRLVEATAAARYACGEAGADTVSVIHFKTQPATLIADRAGQVSVMFQQSAASGSLYEGRNTRLWEHQGKVRIQWGYDVPVQECRVSTVQTSGDVSKN